MLPRKKRRPRISQSLISMAETRAYIQQTAIKIYSEVKDVIFACPMNMERITLVQYQNSYTNFLDMLVQYQHSTGLALLQTLEIEKVTNNRFSKTIQKGDHHAVGMQMISNPSTLLPKIEPSTCFNKSQTFLLGPDWHGPFYPLRHKICVQTFFLGPDQHGPFYSITS